jgi:hypothetical protein
MDVRCTLAASYACLEQKIRRAEVQKVGTCCCGNRLAVDVRCTLAASYACLEQKIRRAEVQKVGSLRLAAASRSMCAVRWLRLTLALNRSLEA